MHKSLTKIYINDMSIKVVVKSNVMGYNKIKISTR